MRPRSPMAEAAGLNPVQRGFDPRRGYRADHPPTIVREMEVRFEEDPDEEPDHPQPSRPGDGAAAPSLIPSVGLPARDWEYSTRVLTVSEVTDGVTLVKALQESATEGWELAEVVDGGEKRVLLMRRPKRAARESRRVGFAPPNHS